MLIGSSDEESLKKESRRIKTLKPENRAHG